MSFRFAADATLLVHLGFIVFAVFGALLIARWRWIVFVHIPAACWAVFIELTGRICPLTPLENHLRNKAGESGYTESFVEHYLLGVIYPEGLTREIQMLLAGGVLLTNLAIYAWLIFSRRNSGAQKRPAKIGKP